MCSKNALTDTRGFVVARLETRVGSNALSKGNPFAVAFSKAAQR